MSAKPSTRDALCEAAIRTASRDGLLCMTLDNVAREAGVSKGGVMYHFPTKDDLVRAMLQYFGDRMERALFRRIAEDPIPHNRWGRAMLDLIFSDDEAIRATPLSADEFSPEVVDKFMLTIIAAAINSPGLIEPLRPVAERMRQRLIDESGGGVDQLFVWLVVDGLFLWQFVGLIDRHDPLCRRISEELRRRIDNPLPVSVPPNVEAPGEMSTEVSAPLANANTTDATITEAEVVTRKPRNRRPLAGKDPR